MKSLSTVLLACIASGAVGAAERCDEALSALRADTQRIGLHQRSYSPEDSARRENVLRLQRSAEILGTEGRDDACVSAVEQAQAFVVRMARPTAVRSENLLGMMVVDANGREIGEVDELVFDMTESVAAYALIEFGGFLGFGEDLVPVPFSALKLGDDGEHLVLEAELKRLELAPRYDEKNLEGMANRDWSRSVHEFYGKDPYWMTQGFHPREITRERPDDQDTLHARSATAAQALAEQAPEPSTAPDEETARWRSQVEAKLDQIVEQRSTLKSTRDEVAALHASQREAGAPKLMERLEDLKREIGELRALATRQDQLLSRLDHEGFPPVTASGSTPVDDDPQAKRDRARGSESVANSGNRQAAEAARMSSSTTAGERNAPRSVGKTDGGASSTSTAREPGNDAKASASASASASTPQPGESSKGEQGVVTGPSSDVLRPAPTPTVPDRLVESRDVGEADTGGRVEMPAGWGDNKTGTQGAAELPAAGEGSSHERPVSSLFNRLDVDGSGHLDRTEAQSDFVIYRYFIALDVNEDDELDPQEFRALIGMKPSFDAKGALLTVDAGPEPAGGSGTASESRAENKPEDKPKNER